MSNQYPSSPLNAYSKAVLLISLIGLIFMILPAFGTEFEGGFLVYILLGLILVTTGILLHFILKKRAKAFTELFSENNLLAKWKLEGRDYEQHAKKRLKRDRKIMLERMFVVLGCVLLPVLIMIFSSDNQEHTFTILIFTMPFVLIFSGFTLVAWASQRKQVTGKHSTYIYISKTGLWIQGDFYLWEGPSKRPLSVRYNPDNRTISIKYLSRNPAHRSARRYIEQNVHILVPSDADTELAKVMEFYG